ncbi:DUF58 domain-containing protein [Eisenibacter elegans]|jgi:uncharacterized protein (DUF58 family)|uniref:DUF58 domain-containing protein n=1 Tax=Eisenibacter elegans TaxID=997 RepID=UPI0003F7B7D0|nr:DUF58 domain-containing protein [Eisenibacter elegans]
MKKILAKIRNYEIRIRKAVHGQMRGNYNSIFKGAGLEFDEVRLYQYGDDVRRIDWNVSAKGSGTFVKIFKEEKEQTVFFLLDVSHSQDIGSGNDTKLELGKEVCGVLALSAAKEDSQIGLICFSDQKERYIKPDKGVKKAYEIIFNLFKLQPRSLRTDLDKFFKFALNLIKRRSIVIVISDFIDQDYEQSLKALARKHDLILIHLLDEKETHLPRLGIVPVFDKELQRTVWMNTSSASFQAQVQERFNHKKRELEALCVQYSANYLSLQTGEDFVPKLIKLFKVRNKKVRSNANAS